MASSTPDPTSTLEVENLRMPLVNTALFERSQADLHKNFRGLDHDPFFKYKNQAQLANLTTHHSNVYMVRYTVGLFLWLSPTTGAFGEEYFDAREGFKRPKGFLSLSIVPFPLDTYRHPASIQLVSHNL